MKKMSDSEAMDYAHKKLSSDLDGIESHSIFDESNEPAEDTHSGVKVEAHGVSVHIKPMDGQQTNGGEQNKDLPTFTEKKEEEEGEFGK